MTLTEGGYIHTEIYGSETDIVQTHDFSTNQDNYSFTFPFAGTSSSGSCNAVSSGTISFDRVLSGNYSRIKWNYSSSCSASVSASPSPIELFLAPYVENDWIIVVSGDVPLYYIFTGASQAEGYAESPGSGYRSPFFDGYAYAECDCDPLIDGVQALATNFLDWTDSEFVPPTPFATNATGVIQPGVLSRFDFMISTGCRAAGAGNFLYGDSRVTNSASLDLILSTAPIAPPLTANKSDAGLVLSWPLWATHFVLQVSDSLATGTNWQPATNIAAPSGDQIATTIDLSAPVRFYRLLSTQ